jgi:hypothetical protein
MKRTFPNLLLRIGGAIVVLSAVAFLLMAIIKILVMSLIVLGAGAIAFKIIRKQHSQFLLSSQQPLAFQNYNAHSLAIQPIQKRVSRRNAAFIPIQ